MVDLEKLQQQERIEAAKLTSKIDTNKDNIQSREEIEGFKAGFNLVET